MEKNSRTEMLPGKRDFYRCCKVRRSATTRKQRLLAAISKLRSAFFTGYKNKICTYHNWRASEASETLSGLYLLHRSACNTRNVLLSAQMSERASVVLICIFTSLYNEVK